MPASQSRCTIGTHFFLYLIFFLVICTLPTLLTSLPIVCTRDCTLSCETCPRYFSCFRFKVYFQCLNTLPRHPWIPPSALCLLQTEPSSLYSNRYIFVRQVVIKKVGYRVILFAIFYQPPSHQCASLHLRIITKPATIFAPQRLHGVWRCSRNTTTRQLYQNLKESRHPQGHFNIDHRLTLQQDLSPQAPRGLLLVYC